MTSNPSAGHFDSATLPAKLRQRARQEPTRVAMRHKTLGIWREYTWADYDERARAVALGLGALGVGPGDKVCIHSENRPEWCWTDIGIQALGAVAVGIYPTSPAAEVSYMLTHSESKVLIAEDEEQVDKAIEVWAQVPTLEHIVVIEPRGVRVLDDPRVTTFEELIASGRSHDGIGYDELVDRIDPSDVAIMVYTSGTTGPPKGAMLSHRNLQVASEGYKAVIRRRARRRGAVVPSAMPRRRAAVHNHPRSRGWIRGQLWRRW